MCVLSCVKYNNCTYFSFVIAITNAQIWHSSENSYQRLNSVTVDNRSILLEVFTCETTFVDNSETNCFVDTEYKNFVFIINIIYTECKHGTAIK